MPVRDIFVHPRENDVIIATHGRSLYVIDDVTPIRTLTSEILNKDVAMLPSRPSMLALPPWNSVRKAMRTIVVRRFRKT